MRKPKTQQERQLEQEKLREILILLSQLFAREEVTAKAIVGCLYDIATVNLINKFCPLWGINATLKYLLRFPRPIAQSLGVKLYVQKKCPQLITDWFYTLVEFPSAMSEKQILEEGELLPTLQQNQLEIKSLQGQVKFLTGFLFTIITLFGGSFFWLTYNWQINPLDLLTNTPIHLNQK
jgi:hypothetical protein